MNRKLICMIGKNCFSFTLNVGLVVRKLYRDTQACPYLPNIGPALEAGNQLNLQWTFL